MEMLNFLQMTSFRRKLCSLLICLFDTMPLIGKMFIKQKFLTVIKFEMIALHCSRQVETMFLSRNLVFNDKLFLAFCF